MVGFVKIFVLCITVFGAISICSAADLEKGKAMFNDPELGGSTNEISCNFCHSDGKDLARYPGQKSVRKIANICIKNDMNGVGIDPYGEDMANLVKYVDSLQTDGPVPERIEGFDCLE